MEGRPTSRQGPSRRRRTGRATRSSLRRSSWRGTLARGFELHRSLPDAFQRAVFMMFLVSEVHPFLDGNGRVARIMMNAELVATGERRLIVPPSSARTT